jgi:hypothetical protein
MLPAGADKIRPLKASPSMRSFIVAIIVFGLTLGISILVLFRYGLSDNQSLPPSTAAETTFTVGTLIAFAVAASHGWSCRCPDGDALARSHVIGGS